MFISYPYPTNKPRRKLKIWTTSPTEVSSEQLFSWHLSRVEGVTKVRHKKNEELRKLWLCQNIYPAIYTWIHVTWYSYYTHIHEAIMWCSLYLVQGVYVLLIIWGIRWYYRLIVLDIVSSKLSIYRMIQMVFRPPRPGIPVFADTLSLVTLIHTERKVRQGKYQNRTDFFFRYRYITSIPISISHIQH